MRSNRVKQFSAIAGLTAASGIAFVSAVPAAFLAKTVVPPYAVSLTPDYSLQVVLSVADQLPVTGDATRTFQMVGIPDGLGARKNNRGEVVVFMNHEFTNGTQSEPLVGEPLNRGALVSKLIVRNDGVALSGDRAYDSTFLDDALVGPAPDTSNATPGFARFCSGSLAEKHHGFDTPIFFANEESGGAATFAGNGGLSVAIFDNEAHGLQALGRFSWEQTVIQPGNKNDLTVAMCLEDGSTNQDPLLDNSQLYMYVGVKNQTPGASTLERNGLVGGTLYVFRALNPAKNSEAGFTSGSVEGTWVAIPGAESMSDVQLEAASDAAGAMVFVRPEDGAFNPRNRNNFLFVTTGGLNGVNELGRLYSMRLNKNNPTGPALLTLMYNADQIVAAGGDTALSPDNIDCSSDYLMICEDGTTQSRAVMTAKGRDGSIWRFDLTASSGIDPTSATRVIELDPPGRDGTNVGAGVWETTGIIDATGLFGPGYWLFAVQAHSPTKAPAPNTVEDGQLLIMKLN